MAINDVVVGPNLGNEFDVGNITADTIRVKLGAGLARLADGTIVAVPAVNTQTILTGLGFVHVDIGATAVTSSLNASATRTGVGQWTLTPPAGALVANASIIEDRATRDDIVIHMEDELATQITMSEQDNGGTAGVLRDNGFTVVWFGSQTVVVP